MRMTHTDPGWLTLTQNDSLWVSTPCDCISNLEYQGSAPVPGGLGYMYIRRQLLGLLPRLIHLLSNPSTFHLIIPNLISEYFRVFGFSLIDDNWHTVNWWYWTTQLIVSNSLSVCHSLLTLYNMVDCQCVALHCVNARATKVQSPALHQTQCAELMLNICYIILHLDHYHIPRDGHEQKQWIYRAVCVYNSSGGSVIWLWTYSE